MGEVAQAMDFRVVLKTLSHTQTSIIWYRMGWNLQGTEQWWWLSGSAELQELNCMVRAM